MKKASDGVLMLFLICVVVGLAVLDMGRSKWTKEETEVKVEAVIENVDESYPDVEEIIQGGMVDFTDKVNLECEYLRVTNVSEEEYDAYLERCITMGYDEIVTDIKGNNGDGRFRSEFPKRNWSIELYYKKETKTMEIYQFKKGGENNGQTSGVVYLLG